jgi:RNA polymerase sigma-70 factor (ECF subfamily)
MSSIQTHDVPSSGFKTYLPTVDWPELLNRVKQNEAGASEELYALTSKGMLFFLRRQMPVHVAEERMHDAFVIVLKAIRDGRIQNAKAFPGYVMTVTKRQYFDHVRRSVSAPECGDEFVVDNLPSKVNDNPDSLLDAKRRSTLVAEVLRSMSPERTEILTRFYILEQSHEQICNEMKLTDTQYRLLKSRAKVDFGERGRQKLTPRKPLYAESFSRMPSADGRPRRASA